MWVLRRCEFRMQNAEMSGRISRGSSFPSHPPTPPPAAEIAGSDFPKCPLTETVSPWGPQQHDP